MNRAISFAKCFLLLRCLEYMPLQSQQSQYKESNSKRVKIFFLLQHFRKKNKKNLMHHYAGLAGCTETGTWSVLSQNCLLVEPIGFCKNTKRKTDRQFFSASGSGRSFPWAEHFVVSVSVAVDAQCTSLLRVCRVREFTPGPRKTRTKPRSWTR